MTILVENLTFNTILGILDFERLTPQKVIIECKIEYDYNQKSNDFINYAEVATHLKSSMQNNKFLLIEDALLSLKESLKVEFPSINSLTLKISKPTIIDDCDVSLQEVFKF